MPIFTVSNAGPGNVVIAAATRGQRFKVTHFELGLVSGNGVYFRSGLTGNALSPTFTGPDGAALSPASTGGYKGFTTNPGEPLVLAITGSGTVTGSVFYDVIYDLPPGQ